jgi:hypothetical protein
MLFPSYITPSSAADLCIEGGSGALEGVALQLVIARKRVWQVTHSVPLPADIYVKRPQASSFTQPLRYAIDSLGRRGLMQCCHG